MSVNFSIIIPVYNRPQEIEELLSSLYYQTYKNPFEIVIIEDGSIFKCDKIIKKFINKLNITYLFKKNSGPGQSRNEGMKIAKGNYFIILDSDVLLPKNYLTIVDTALQKNYTDAFGSHDKAHQSFTVIQKAINYAMTSFLTTGGLRNNNNTNNKFQLRSFNMGISKNSFQKIKGFSKQNYGEDIDLTYKLWKNNFKTQFIKQAFVYHKRRSNFKQFFNQTFNFGAARPILNKQYKNSAKITYWFPSLFIIALAISLVLLTNKYYHFYLLFMLYFNLIFLDSLLKNKNILVAVLSIFTTIAQFLGYGLGFLRSQFRLNVLKMTFIKTFPKMFT